MNGEIDPTVLASLPPSMQLDLLVQVSASCILVIRSSQHRQFAFHLLNIPLILTFIIDVLYADERKIDGRKQTKVSESQEGWF